MTANHGACGADPDRAVDYLLGELADAAAERFEEHLFVCPVCAARIESIRRIGVSVAEAVRNAAVGANVNGAFLERAARDGLTLREYRIPAGGSVACTAGPEDLVLVRLAADFGAVTDLRLKVAFHDLETDEKLPAVTRDVTADRDLGEVLLVFPGAAVRAYPRSRWTLEVHGSARSGRAELGRFVMDHTP